MDFVKNWIACCAFALLITGCDIVPQFYDSNEYLILAEIETSSRLLADECVELDSMAVMPRIDGLYEKAELFRTYTFFQPKNMEIAEQAEIIATNIGELRARYRQGKPSEKYCQLKAETIKVSSQRVLSTLGNKTRK